MTSKRRLRAIEKQRQALELRKAGVDYGRIAEAVGYAGRAGAYKAVLAGLKAALREPADAVRELELSRCDALLQSVWGRALKGDLAAISTALRIMDRRAKLLRLDAPDRVDVELRVRTMAAALGLDPDAAVAEAERLLHDGRHHAPVR